MRVNDIADSLVVIAADLHVDDCAILASMPALKPAKTGLCDRTNVCGDYRWRFGCFDILNVHLEKFNPRVLKHAAERFIDIEDATGRIVDPEAVERRLQNGSINAFVVLDQPKGCLRRGERRLLHFGHDLDPRMKENHRNTKARRKIYDSIIVCPCGVYVSASESRDYLM